MKDGKIGFGIVGIGSISKTHAIAINKNSDAYLAGCFHPKMEKAEKWAKENNCKAFDSLQKMLSDPEIDAITVTTPSGNHLDSALEAIKAGKHVIIEKPIEITEDRVNVLISEAKKHNVVLEGIFQSRFHDVASITKKAIDEGRLGKLTICDAQIKWFRSQAYYDSGAWRGTWALDGGGCLMNQGIHAIDLLLYLVGNPTEVFGYTGMLAHSGIEVEDTAAAVLKFPNGAIGVIEGSTAAYPGSLKKLEICGSKGSITIEEDSITKWQFEEEKPEDAEIRERYGVTASKGGASDPMAINTLGHEKNFKDFTNAIKNGDTPFVSGEESLRSVHLIRCIYESVKQGKPVKF